MIIKCTEEWKKRIFSYIGNDYERCLYIYSDLTKYGVDSQNVSTWVDVIGDSIRAVVMKYHNGMHIYSSKLDYNKTEMVDLIRKAKPSMVLGTRDVIADIADMLEGYGSEYGYVKKMKKNVDDYICEHIKTASLKDVARLTEVLMSDEEFTVSYTYDEMFRQISERILDGYGKTFYICNEKEICSELGISAEMDKFMIISNVYTVKKYRGKQYATQLFRYIGHISEDKNVYLFCYGDRLSRYYDTIGFETVQYWGKIFIKA